MKYFYAKTENVFGKTPYVFVPQKYTVLESGDDKLASPSDLGVSTSPSLPSFSNPSSDPPSTVSQYPPPSYSSKNQSRRGYYLFQKEKRENLKKQYPDVPHNPISHETYDQETPSEISKRLGAEWRKIHQVSKEDYHRRAAALEQ